MRQLGFALLAGVSVAVVGETQAQTHTQIQTQAQSPEACVSGDPSCNRYDEFFQGLRDQIAPLITQIDPLMGQLAELLGDLSGWHAPEVLPNGDILIRRRREPEVAPDRNERGGEDQESEASGSGEAPLEL